MLLLAPVPLPISLTLPAAAAPACDARQRQALLAPDNAPLVLACSVGLAPEDRVVRRIVIEGNRASGVEIDCHGGAIGDPSRPAAFPHFAVEIRSVPAAPGPAGEPRWDAPSDVTLRNCRIFGHVRVWGMGINGQGEAVRRSSHGLGHTERAQAAAPRRVRILDSTLTGLGSIPLYLGPGVTEFTLQRSRISGTSSSVGLYLDAESGRNVIADNDFDVQAGRETIAVDGSAQNRIVGNRIALGYQRGIDLYRNCGEGGTVRHQTPSDNVITDNTFTYTKYFYPTPIKVGSREGWRLYCGEDAGYPFGSSLDNGDHATGNQVERNTVAP